jgi:hypothetical protein
MDSTSLVTEEISAGSAVLQRLDAAHIPVRAAWWAYSQDAGEWRYFVATPLADVEGPRSVYERIQRALQRGENTRDFPLWRVVTVTPKSKFVAMLKRFVGKLESPQGRAVAVPSGAATDTNVLVYRV